MPWFLPLKQYIWATKDFHLYLRLTPCVAFKTFYTRGKAADNLKSTMQSLISKQVKDKEVAMRLTPNYDIGCKRPTFSDIYMPTFNNPCVELNTTGIKQITSKGIVTADERELQFDAIVFATGFDVTRSFNAFVQVGSENKDFAEQEPSWGSPSPTNRTSSCSSAPARSTPL